MTKFKKYLYKFLGLFINKYNMNSAYPKHGPWIIKGNILLYNAGNKAYKKWMISSYIHTDPGKRLPISFRCDGLDAPSTFFNVKLQKVSRKMCDKKLFALGFVETPDNQEVYEKTFEVICHNEDELRSLHLTVTNIVKEITWQM